MSIQATRKPSVVIESFTDRIHSPGVDPPKPKTEIVPLDPSPEPPASGKVETIEEMLARLEKV